MNDVPPREVLIFTEALKLTLPERALYLEQSCSSDEPLRQRVEGLLRAYEQAGDFMENLPPETPATEKDH